MDLPPNTYDRIMRFRVTLPGNDTPEEQDPSLVITGEETEPWPGVLIHDAELLSSSKVEA